MPGAAWKGVGVHHEQVRVRAAIHGERNCVFAFQRSERLAENNYRQGPLQQVCPVFCDTGDRLNSTALAFENLLTGVQQNGIVAVTKNNPLRARLLQSFCFRARTGSEHAFKGGRPPRVLLSGGVL